MNIRLKLCQTYNQAIAVFSKFKPRYFSNFVFKCWNWARPHFNLIAVNWTVDVNNEASLEEKLTGMSQEIKVHIVGVYRSPSNFNSEIYLASNTIENRRNFARSVLCKWEFNHVRGLVPGISLYNRSNTITNKSTTYFLTFGYFISAKEFVESRCCSMRCCGQTTFTQSITRT